MGNEMVTYSHLLTDYCLNLVQKLGAVTWIIIAALVHYISLQSKLVPF